MARKTRTFTDLDFNFSIHPSNGDVSSKYDEEAIKQSIKNLILTRNFERPFRSYLGSPIYSLLFENVSPLVTTMMEKVISDVIYNHEPRVNLQDVTVVYSPDNTSMFVTIIFRIINTTTPVEVNLILERTR